MTWKNDVKTVRHVVNGTACRVKDDNIARARRIGLEGVDTNRNKRRHGRVYTDQVAATSDLTVDKLVHGDYRINGLARHEEGGGVKVYSSVCRTFTETKDLLSCTANTLTSAYQQTRPWRTGYWACYIAQGCDPVYSSSTTCEKVVFGRIESKLLKVAGFLNCSVGEYVGEVRSGRRELLDHDRNVSRSWGAWVRETKSWAADRPIDHVGVVADKGCCGGTQVAKLDRVYLQAAFLVCRYTDKKDSCARA